MIACAIQAAGLRITESPIDRKEGWDHGARHDPKIRSGIYRRRIILIQLASRPSWQLPPHLPTFPSYHIPIILLVHERLVSSPQVLESQQNPHSRSTLATSSLPSPRPNHTIFKHHLLHPKTSFRARCRKMCGIVALFAPNELLPKDGLKSRLDAALERIEHRGPDARGRWVSESSRCGPSFNMRLLSYTAHDAY